MFTFISKYIWLKTRGLGQGPRIIVQSATGVRGCGPHNHSSYWSGPKHKRSDGRSKCRSDGGCYLRSWIEV
jgi:hypothetical protein